MWLLFKNTKETNWMGNERKTDWNYCKWSKKWFCRQIKKTLPTTHLNELVQPKSWGWKGIIKPIRENGSNVNRVGRNMLIQAVIEALGDFLLETQNSRIKQ